MSENKINDKNEFFEISGPLKFSGDFVLQGAKNAACPILAYSINLSTVLLHNLPDILDIRVFINILSDLGSEIIKKSNNSYLINNKKVKLNKIPTINAKKILYSENVHHEYWMGALLAKFRKVIITDKGGCNIGERNWNFHFDAFKQLGAEIRYFNNELIIEFRNKPRGGVIVLPYKSVGATCNILMLASSIEEEVIIKNAAIEPEIMNLIEFLKKIGIKISINKNNIKIKGKESFTHESIEFTIMDDRIELGSILSLIIATNSPGMRIYSSLSKMYIKNIIDVFKLIGLDIKILKNLILIENNKDFKPIEITANPFPGFPTDLQPQLVACLTTVNGVSKIKDNVFPKRFGYIQVLNEMGAKVYVDVNQAIIHGKTSLKGINCRASDIRGGMALLISCCSAKGRSKITNSYYLTRGHEMLVYRLNNLISRG